MDKDSSEGRGLKECCRRRKYVQMIIHPAISQLTDSRDRENNLRRKRINTDKYDIRSVRGILGSLGILDWG